MKKSVKYITLVIGSLMAFINLLIAILLLTDIKTLNSPLTLVLPELFLLFLIATFITLAIWGFKFSNEKNHKTTLIVMAVLLSVSILFAILAKAINPHIHQNSTTTTIVDAPTFDMTYDEFMDDYENIAGRLTYKQTITDDKNPNYEQVSGFKTLDNDSMVNLSVYYNKISKKITQITMFSELENNENLDFAVDSLWALYMLTADKDLNTSAIHEKIKFLNAGVWNANNESHYAELYEDDLIKIFVSGDEYIHISFTPSEKD